MLGVLTRTVHEHFHFPFPGESDMLISTSHRESVISLLLLFIVLCGYQIYQFLIYLSLDSVCKGIKLYLHEVPDTNVVVCSRTYTDILKYKIIN